jgi:proteasome lid subunit RPN8/RPN11
MTDLVTVRVFPTRSDAEIVKARLGAAGIDAIVLADDEGGLNPGFYAYYGVRVAVRAADRDTAELVLAPGDDAVVLDPQIVEGMMAHAKFTYPEEACGLLAGDVAGVRMVYCLTNVEHAADRFTVAAHEHYHAWQHAEAHGWDLVGVFHSHPRSAALPSPADLAGALDSSWIYLIVGPVTGDSELRAYRIRAGAATEMAVVVPG